MPVLWLDTAFEFQHQKQQYPTFNITFNDIHNILKYILPVEWGKNAFVINLLP